MGLGPRAGPHPRTPQHRGGHPTRDLHRGRRTQLHLEGQSITYGDSTTPARGCTLSTPGVTRHRADSLRHVDEDVLCAVLRRDEPVALGARELLADALEDGPSGGSRRAAGGKGRRRLGAGSWLWVGTGTASPGGAGTARPVLTRSRSWSSWWAAGWAGPAAGGCPAPRRGCPRAGRGRWATPGTWASAGAALPAGRRAPTTWWERGAPPSCGRAAAGRGLLPAAWRAREGAVTGSC